MAVAGTPYTFTDPDHTLFIVNPAANSGRSTSTFNWIKSGFDFDEETAYSVIQTTPEQTDSGLVVQEWLDNTDCPITPSDGDVLRVFACGGDGTLSPVIRQFHEKRDTVQIGVLPLGTLNDCAHALNLFPKTQNDFLDIIHGTQGASIGSYTIKQLTPEGEPTDNESIAFIDAFAGISRDTLKSKEAADESPDCLARTRWLIGSNMETNLRALSATWRWKGLSIRIVDHEQQELYSGDIGNLAMTTLGFIGDLKLSPSIRPQWYHNDQLRGEVHIAEDGGIFMNVPRLIKLTSAGHRNGCDWSKGFPIEHGKSLTIYDTNNSGNLLELENSQTFEFPFKATWQQNQAVLVAGDPPN
ncbi:acylglycerol kinase family protein [Parashewanella tropica]|uniref:acylglycerol kinase family protein n=1 Tax=Parashewanella tropica TaxID=2547970 RepID=UPI0010599C39|nr:acylglycerol kinase family protein [Parashewanella tropica]